MRRGRGKGKKQNASAREDHGSGEEDEKIPAYRRRGRPLKPMKDDFEEEEDEEELVEKMEEEEEEEDDSVTSRKQENDRKRKMSNGGSNTDDVKQEKINGLGSKSSTDGSTKSASTGFRQNGNRRKSKPRRAAEAVVECNGV